MKPIKKFAVFAVLLFSHFVLACDACKLEQPAITRNYTHGEGPRGNIDWIIVAIVALIAIYTLLFSIKYLAKPGEKMKSHIKYSILQD